MEFSYTTETTVYATDACVYLREDGKEKVANLMVTTYTPDTDKLSTKTFFLREGHEFWALKHLENFQQLKRQWLVELGKDPDLYSLGTVATVVQGDNQHQITTGTPNKLTLLSYDSLSLIFPSTLSQGSSVSCFMPRLTLFFSSSNFRT